MKGAPACYVEAVRALREAGVSLRGGVRIAAVSGEIERTQYGDATGAQYRGYAAGTRYLVTHGGVADMCLLGEPTEGKVVLGHYGALWLRIRVHGSFIHTAFAEGKRHENSILRMHEVLAPVPDWWSSSSARTSRWTGSCRRRRSTLAWRWRCAVSSDVYTLPEGLPVPQDDGADGDLPGLELPDLVLPSSQGDVNVRDFDV